MGHQKKSFKKFLTLMMVIIFMFSGSLSARKETYKAWLIVVKQDGQKVQGELLNVNDSEIILISHSQTGIAIPLNEIKMIKYKKKGQFLKGAAVGLGVSLILGGFLANSLKDDNLNFLNGSLVYGSFFGIPCAVMFGFLNSHMTQKRIYIFENASPEQVALNLNKLKMLARF